MNTTGIFPTRILNNGLVCPSMGLGTAYMDNVGEIVYESIKQGARLIDTAAKYGNEKEIGEGLTKAIKENIVKREDMFIITKLSFYDRSNPEGAIKKSLENLQLSYIDLYLDHWPMTIYSSKDIIKEKNPVHIVWGKMEKLVGLGYTKAIGVSNYNVQSMLNLLSFCDIKPAVLEIEYHPYLIQSGIKELCDRNNILLIGFNSLVKGPYIDKFHKETKVDLLEEDIVKSLGKKYNRTPGQIALNWALAQGIIVIPKTSNPKRMKENLGAMEFKISDEDIKEINELNRNMRFCSSINWEYIFDGYDYFS